MKHLLIITLISLILVAEFLDRSEGGAETANVRRRSNVPSANGRRRSISEPSANRRSISAPSENGRRRSSPPSAKGRRRYNLSTDNKLGNEVPVAISNQMKHKGKLTYDP